MENPYTHAAAPAPATAEGQRLADYEAAIGPNSGYYLKYFEAFDAGESRASWHWPAFFVPSFWFMFRKMWLPGILTLLWPVIAYFVLGIALIAIAAATKAVPVTAMIVGGLVFIAPYFVIPIYANALYWRHVRKLIGSLPNSVAQVPDKRIARLERNGGTGVGPMIAVIVGGGFFFIFVVGILAAIAIPAYQDYTIRAQITEGLDLASPLKAQVAEFWTQHQTWPEQADLGDQIPSGKYVTQVTAHAGSVVITFGNQANAKLANQRLAILAGVGPGGDIVWACGNASLPDGVKSSGGPYGSDVENKYLPAKCRSQ